MTGHQVPEKKQTALGLYVTAQEAYEMWQADPEGVNILDVRIPEEYLFVGHPEMARNIPLLFVRYEWDAEKNQPAVQPNPDFRLCCDEGVFARRHAAGHVPLRGPERAGRQRLWPKRASRRPTTSSTASRATRSTIPAAPTTASG